MWFSFKPTSIKVGGEIFTVKRVISNFLFPRITIWTDWDLWRKLWSSKLKELICHISIGRTNGMWNIRLSTYQGIHEVAYCTGVWNLINIASFLMCLWWLCCWKLEMSSNKSTHRFSMFHFKMFQDFLNILLLSKK